MSKQKRVLIGDHACYATAVEKLHDLRNEASRLESLLQIRRSPVDVEAQARHLLAGGGIAVAEPEIDTREIQRQLAIVRAAVKLQESAVDAAAVDASRAECSVRKPDFDAAVAKVRHAVEQLLVASGSLDAAYFAFENEGFRAVGIPSHGQCRLTENVQHSLKVWLSETPK